MTAWKDKRVVIKVGSSTLTHSTGLINIRRIEALVKTLSDLKNAGNQIILVSSGAGAVGMGKLGLLEKPKDTPSKQAAAAVGQCALMHLYDELFARFNQTVAQILLTRDVFDNPERKTHAFNTFCRLLDFSVLPIVNENDTVAVEEIEFGDNDTLAAMVAVLLEADALVLLSDIDGLYEANPAQNPKAKLLPVVEKITEKITALAGPSGSNRGTGGMITKLMAAKTVTAAGISMAIINGKNPENLYHLFDGQQVGTLFLPAQKG